ncbi:STAS domain-containing protein [Nocardioides coralli]|uniref:STAS domain-containing protein n=1 Tax=Nocardioides coralli TaxID=2872154 RepID=UPI001CA43394|nr:STAS domain-containing protein [Nocardioides coralli]QZY30200.1 STAS domain-containing protein [Nocardioides coralli]
MEMTTEGPTLVLSGDFDGRSTARVRQELHERLAAPEHEIVVDLSAVEAVDVSALRVLAFASHEAARTGHSVRLRGAGPTVRRMLHLTRLRRFVELEPSAA